MIDKDHICMSLHNALSKFTAGCKTSLFPSPFPIPIS